jgi:hypothetical protein
VEIKRHLGYVFNLAATQKPLYVQASEKAYDASVYSSQERSAGYIGGTSDVAARCY